MYVTDQQIMPERYSHPMTKANWINPFKSGLKMSSDAFQKKVILMRQDQWKTEDDIIQLG